MSVYTLKTVRWKRSNTDIPTKKVYVAYFTTVLLPLQKHQENHHELHDHRWPI